MLETVVMPITYKCNCNCIMCSIPERKSKDLPVDFYNRIFDDKNLNCIKSINITGGEPFLCKGLENIVEIVINKCKNLKEIIFSTNGTLAQSKERIESLICKYSKCKFIVSVSLDSVNDHADEIRGIKNIHIKQMDFITQLAELKERYSNLNVVASMTITKKNCRDILNVFKWAKSTGVLVDYIYATVNSAYINSAKKKEQFVVSTEDNRQIVDDLKKIYKEKIIASDQLYYENLFEKLLYHTKCKRPCINYEKRSMLIEANGIVRICGMSEKAYLGNLLEESFTDIYNKEVPNKLRDVCDTCLTNSYNSYTRESQQQLANEMLRKVAKLRTNPSNMH